MKSVECENGENVWMYAECEISELYPDGKTLGLTQRGKKMKNERRNGGRAVREEEEEEERG